MELIPSRYLLQHHSGHFVNHSAAQLRMALLCSSYLTFPCFSPDIDISEIEASVYRGDYAFQEYAALNWIHHIKCLIRCGTNVDISSLKRAAVTLYQRHFEQSDTVTLYETIQDLGHNAHSLSRAMDHCQKSYDTVDNITVNEIDSGKVKTLWSLNCS